MKKIISIIVLAGSALYGIALAQSRDPFTPYAPPVPAAGVSNLMAVDPRKIGNPLTEKPLSAYNVIGVAISRKNSLAVLKSRDKQEYFAYIGDEVGVEGGKIEKINSEGIAVNIAGKIINLKVSNRLEIQDEKQTDEVK